MSCAPPDEVGSPCRHKIQKCTGFLFAFYNYSQVPQTTWIEKFVHVVTGSDSIHVAILPVPNCLLKVSQNISSGFLRDNNENNNNDAIIEVHKLQVEDRTFTAFMFSGYEIQKASSVLNEKYEYIFLPVDESSQYVNGIRFLQSLGGSGYNYLGLPLTVLPNSLKPPVRNSEFNSHCAPSKVFCSQVGLMLLYRCGLLRDPEEIDPSSCNPGDLRKILTLRAGGLCCKRNCIEISNMALHESLLSQPRVQYNIFGNRARVAQPKYVTLPQLETHQFVLSSINNNNNNNYQSI
jgi:hypothetical protein